MPQVNISKALKLRNRLAQRLDRVNADIKRFNSVIEEQQNVVDVNKLIDERLLLRSNLADLKAKLHVASVPVIDKLIGLSELKGEIAFLNSVPTKEGVERHDYQNTNVTYVAKIRKPDMDIRVKQAESLLDLVQGEISDYNASTKMEVNQETLDLGS